MGIIKFKLLFILSSLVLVFLPAGAMANTLQPGQNVNNENTEEQNESVNNNNNEEQQNGYSEPAEEDNWTEPEESYDAGNNNNEYNDNNDYNNNNENYYDSGNNNENYYDGGNNYNNNNENTWETEQDVTEQYEEPVQEEPVIEEPADPVYEEPVIEEPVIEEEPAETVAPEPSVDVNTLDAEAFSISGEVIDEDSTGISDIELILSGESFEEQSVLTEKDGGFLFEEVPSGDYQIEVKPSEDYEVTESIMDLEITDRSKKGLKINLTAVEEEEAAEEDPEPVETDEDVLAAETGSLSSMDWTLIGTGTVFALISLFVLLFKKVRKN